VRDRGREEGRRRKGQSAYGYSLGGRKKEVLVYLAWHHYF
jgi:hypothetical protein